VNRASHKKAKIEDAIFEEVLEFVEFDRLLSIFNNFFCHILLANTNNENRKYSNLFKISPKLTKISFNLEISKFQKKLVFLKNQFR